MKNDLFIRYLNEMNLSNIQIESILDVHKSLFESEYDDNKKIIDIFIRKIISVIENNKIGILNRKEISTDIVVDLPYQVKTLPMQIKFTLLITRKRKYIENVSMVNNYSDDGKLVLVIPYKTMLPDRYTESEFNMHGASYPFMSRKRLDIHGGIASMYSILTHEVQHILDIADKMDMDKLYDGFEHGKVTEEQEYNASLIEINARISQIYSEYILNINRVFSDIVDRFYSGKDIQKFIVRKLQVELPKILSELDTDMWNILVLGEDLTDYPNNFKDYLEGRFAEIKNSVRAYVDEKIKQYSMEEPYWPKNISSLDDVLSYDTNGVNEDDIHQSNHIGKYSIF